MIKLRTIAKTHWFLLALALVMGFTFLFPTTSLGISAWIHISAVVFGVMFLMSFTLETGAIIHSMHKPLVLACGFILVYAVVPIIAFMCAKILLRNHVEYRIGLLVMASMPCTLASATIWTRMAGGNDAVSLFITLLTNLLTFILTPLILLFFLQTSVQIPIDDMIGRLVLVVVIPVVLGQLTRQYTPLLKLSRNLKPVFSKICQILILLMVFKGCSGAVDSVIHTVKQSGFGWVVLLILAVVITHILSLVAAWLSSKALNFHRGDSIALLFAGSQKTLPEALYVAGTFFPQLSLATIPLIVFHASQLVIDSVIAEKINQKPKEE